MRRLIVVLAAFLCFFTLTDEAIISTGGCPHCPPAGPNVAAQTPGPSQSIYNSPYYTCNQNWYVSTTGNDTTGTGTAGNPWATLNKANSSITVTGTGSWCVNVAAGTYSAGVNMTTGGTTASSAGYVVYRCQTLDGCIIDDPGNQSANAAFAYQASYAIADGFVLNNGTPTGNTSAFQVGVGTAGGPALVAHHLWFINGIIENGYSQSGVQWNPVDFVYLVHNKIFLTANGNCGGINGSGISFASNIAVETANPSYVLTADDKSNAMIGNVTDPNNGAQALFRIFVMWNVVYNNYIQTGCGLHTDGNGIIMDTNSSDCFPDNTGCLAGSTVAYLRGQLVAFNVIYNNGGVCIEPTSSAYVTIANNTCYNNGMDTVVSAQTGDNLNSGGGSTAWGITVVNNVVVTVCPLPGTGRQDNPFNPDNNPGLPNVTTTLSAAVSAGATSISVASAANFPAGTNGPDFNNSYSLPGGNLIYVAGEVMRVTAGWGTTTWTVTRGFYGTTAGAYTSGTTVQYLPNYYAGNITYMKVNAGCTATEVQVFNGNYYTISDTSFCHAENATTYCVTGSLNDGGTDPLWVSVGGYNGGTAGTESTQPSATNFALKATSPAIGFGQTPAWLPSTAADAGACHHTLTTCP